ncbi:MAG: immunoglobulin domain-containing protein [Planctomycetota bacterium]
MRMAIVALLVSFAGGVAGAQTVTDLGRLPGGTGSFPAALSDNGAIISGSATVSGGSARAWRWTAATGLVNLSVPPGADHSYGYGMSGDGLVVIGAAGNQSYDTACRWTQATGIQSLGSIAPGQPSFASDASFDGSIIFGYGYLANSEESAFKWTSTTGMQPFGQRLAGTHHSVGLAVNGSGTSYVGYCFNNAPSLIYPTACRWTAAGAVTSLGTLPGSVMSVPSDLSADGSVVVGYAADGTGGNVRAFKWTAASGMQDLGTPPDSTQAVAAGLTGDGSVVVGYAIVAGAASACVWVGNAQAQPLDLYLQAQGISTAGWVFETAGISSEGSAMAGSGLHNGVPTAWYAGVAGCTSAPTITQQPVSQSVVQGAGVSFSVIATGVGVHYQWYKGPTLLATATSSVYSIDATALGDAGDYTCSLTSACGNVTTSVATLTVQSGCPEPIFVSEPGDMTIIAGQSVSFEVSVTSDTEPHFQWRKDNVAISGARDARLDIEHVTELEIGEYDCVVTNACGSASSHPATLALCLADFDGDGTVDFFDYDAFVNCFEGLACPPGKTADFDGDGAVDFFDYDAFVLAFEEGC